jgi:hypothetical protein
VLRSTDGGATWTPLADGFPQPLRGNIEALSLARSPQSVALFAATTAGEVYTGDARRGAWRRIAAELPAVSKVGHYRRFAARGA